MVFKKGNKINKGRIPWNKWKKWSNKIKQKISQSHKGLISPRKGVKLLQKTKDKISIQAKLRLKDKTKHPLYGKKHSKKSRKKMSISHKKTWDNGKVHGLLGKPRINKIKQKIRIKVRKYALSHPEEYRQKAINSLKKQSKNKTSKAEIVLKKYLKNKKIKHIHHYEYPLGIADFYLPNRNLIIQCYGSYWHSKPDYIKRDKKQNKWFRENNYKLLILNSEKILKEGVYDV